MRLVVLASLGGCTFSMPVHGLEPDPPARWAFWLGRPAFAEVESLQPTLSWEAFPRLFDRDNDPERDLSRVRDVTYDLRIWRADTGHDVVMLVRGNQASWNPGSTVPGNVTYSRQGIAATSHRVEVPLAPSTKYYWTVRARFVLDGLPRITEWSYQGTKRGALLHPPVFSYFRFETPSE